MAVDYAGQMPRRATFALLGALGGVALLFLTWFLAFQVRVFEHADQSIFNGFAGLKHHSHVGRLAYFVAHLCDPNPYLYFAAIPVLIALLRGRWRVALAITAIVVGANVTTQLLKPLLAEPRAAWLVPGSLRISPASWPSGHATAAMALALSMVLAVPARFKPLAAALGAAFAIAVSYSFLALGWHYPSDVFGGYLVAGIWTLLAVAAVFATDRSRLAQTDPGLRSLPIGRALTPAALALVSAVALIFMVALARPHGVVLYARAHGAFIAGAAAIAVVGLSLATGLMLVLRR